MSLVGQNPEFKEMHKRNLQKGMTKVALLFKCSGKLARILIGMVQRGEMYRAEQLQRLAGRIMESEHD